MSHVKVSVFGLNWKASVKVCRLHFFNLALIKKGQYHYQADGCAGEWEWDKWPSYHFLTRLLIESSDNIQDNLLQMLHLDPFWLISLPVSNVTIEMAFSRLTCYKYKRTGMHYKENLAKYMWVHCNPIKQRLTQWSMIFFWDVMTSDISFHILNLMLTHIIIAVLSYFVICMFIWQQHVAHPS